MGVSKNQGSEYRPTNSRSLLIIRTPTIKTPNLQKQPRGSDTAPKVASPWLSCNEMPRSLDWIAVKELNLSYYNMEI